MAEVKDSAGRGKYSKVIRGLHDGIRALESQMNRAIKERDDRIHVMVKALEKIEYASRKDSLTETERLQSVRTVVCAELSRRGRHEQRGEDRDRGLST